VFIYNVLCVMLMTAVSLKNVSDTEHYLDLNAAFKEVKKMGGSLKFQATNSDLRNNMSFRNQRNKNLLLLPFSSFLLRK